MARAFPVLLSVLIMLLAAPALAADTAASRPGSAAWQDVFAGIFAELLNGSDSNVAAESAPVAVRELRELLIELEQNTKYTAQNGGWRARRLDWQRALRAATTDSAVAGAAAEFCASLTDDALTADGRARRPGWATVLERRSQEAIAAVLLALEENLSAAATDELWRDRRADWRREVQAVGGPAVAINLTTADAADSVAGELLLQLEQATRTEYFVKNWRRQREQWRQQAARASEAETAAVLLRQLGAAYATTAFRGSWLTVRRSAWLAAAGTAQGRAQWCELLLELEDNIDWSALHERWPADRDTWTAAVERYRGSAMPPAIDGALSAPGAARVGALLLELEENILARSQETGWSEQRDSWVAAVTSAAPAQLAQLLRQLAGSLRPESLDSGWHDHALPAETITEQVAWLRALAAALRPEAMVADWQLRREAWAEEADAAVQADAGRPATAVVAVSADRSQRKSLAELLQQLEEVTKSEAQAGSWPAQRRQWQARAQRTEVTVTELAALLREYADSLRLTALQDEWPERRESWRREVQCANTVAVLTALLLELEKAVVWEATEERWHDERGDWLARGEWLVNGGGTTTAEPAAALLAARTLAERLDELEQMLLYSAQTADWPQNRGDWLAANRTAGTLAAIITQTLALEGSLGDGALSGSWPGRRAAWRARVAGARDAGMVAARLLELERALL
ncbi:MAG TPA: hypothetical protein PKM88_09970, partial [bacterium]|nr:hypothetical protein [bacterium]